MMHGPINIRFSRRKRSYYTGKRRSFVEASKEIELKVNVDKTKYVVMSRDQNAGRSHGIKIDSSSFERVVEFTYL